MRSRSGYFKLGLFVISAFILGVIALLVLGLGQIFQKNTYIETYLDESVQGLDIGSPVKYRGVKVGVVNEIDFVRNVYDLDPDSEEFFEYGKYVYIRINLQRGFGSSSVTGNDAVLEQLIEDGLRVRLAAQGLTGQAYLEVDYLPPDRNPPLPITWEPDVTYIPSAPSAISRLSSAVDNIVEKIDQTEVTQIARDLDRLLVLLADNVEAARIPELTREMTLTLSEIRRTNAEIRTVVGSEQFQSSPQKLDESLS
ncbi:MAG: MCE family protein, partial [Leptospiraceae bacterium]|nr:MCE family protein [Leptospiraceae bacterium]